MGLTVQQIQQRLEQIEQDVFDRQAKGESAAEAFHKAKRDYELEYAKKFMNADGTVTERKLKATRAMDNEPAYTELMECEGAYEGWRAAMRTLELRASIGQSLLKNQRELGG
jgi:multidrug resistance efflux pump